MNYEKIYKDIDALTKMYESRIEKLTANLKVVERQRDEALKLCEGYKKQNQLLKHGLNQISGHFKRQAE